MFQLVSSALRGTVLPCLALLALSTMAESVRAQTATRAGIAVQGAPVYASLWRDGNQRSLEELTALVQSDNPFERQFAVVQLSEIADVAPAAVAPIIEALADTSLEVRLTALASLVRLGPDADRALIDALGDGRTGLSYEYFSKKRNSNSKRDLAANDMSFTALQQRHVRTSALVEGYNRWLAKSVPTELKAPSIWRLGTIGTGGNKVENRTGLQRLLLVVAGHKPDDAAALLPLLESPEVAVRHSALTSLSRADEMPGTLVGALDPIASHEDELLQPMALAALARGRGPEAQRLFVAALAARSETTRARAVEALDIESPIFASALGAALRDSSAAVRQRAIARAVVLDPEPVTDILRRSEAYACAETTSPQPRAAPALPEDFVSLILAERRRVPKPHVSLAEALILLGCHWPATAARIVSELTSDLASTVQTQRELAIEVLGVLARRGHAVDISGWLIGAGRQWQNDLAARNASHLLEYGQFERAALDQFLRWYRSLPDTGGGSDPYAVLGSNRRMASIAGERARNLLQADGGKKPGEVVLATAGIDPASDLPDVVLKAIDSILRESTADPRTRARAADALVRTTAGSRNLMLDLVASGPPETVSAIIGPFANPRGLVLDEEMAAAVTSAASRLPAPGLQKALNALARVEKAPPGLAQLLASSARHREAWVRAAAVQAWLNHRLPAGPEARALVSDSDASVREAAVRLIPLMRDTPERLALLAERLAAKERDWEAEAAKSREAAKSGVRVFYNSSEHRYTLAAAAGSGPVGVELANRYLASSGHVDASDFSDLSGYAQVLHTGLMARLERLSAVSDEETGSLRREIIKALGAAVADSSVRDRLVALATGASEPDRITAGEVLLSRGFDPWADERGIVPALMISDVTGRARTWLDQALERLYPYWGPVLMSGRGQSLPDFPWPPPRGYKSMVVPRALLGGDVDTLGKVHDVLVGALTGTGGFEWGLFGGVPGGFALVARMERISQDGTPYPGQARWTSEGTPLVGLKDFLGNLFFEKPGYFRIISFVVTDDVNFLPDPQANLPSIDLGGRVMPPEVRVKPFGPSQELIALVYTFERKTGAQMSNWETAENAQQHIAAAGVWSALSKR